MSSGIARRQGRIGVHLLARKGAIKTRECAVIGKVVTIQS